MAKKSKDGEQQITYKKYTTKKLIEAIKYYLAMGLKNSDAIAAKLEANPQVVADTMYKYSLLSYKWWING